MRIANPGARGRVSLLRTFTPLILNIPELLMPGRSIRTFTVLPHLPERLQALQKLAYNMWWCWNPEAAALFRRIDGDAFESLDHSPVKLLGVVSQDRLQELLHDDGFLAHMDRVEEAFDNYMG